MRTPPFFLKLTVLLQPFITRISATSTSQAVTNTAVASSARRAYSVHNPNSVRAIPRLSHPICVRNFTCAAPQKQDFQTIMADLKKENECAQKFAESVVVEEAEVKSSGKTPVQGNEEKQEDEADAVKLPPLSAQDYRVFNSMAEHMEYFHNHFRQSWTLLYTACINNKRPANLSLKQFLSTGLQFISHLTAHHGIEEQHIFPILARRMPEFQNGKGGDNAAELLRQHREIHRGMDVFEEYLRQCKSGETELELKVLKIKMDSWGEVLWKHLDQEVKTLGAENMRKYWTLEEMRRMPM